MISIRKDNKHEVEQTDSGEDLDESLHEEEEGVELDEPLVDPQSDEQEINAVDDASST